MLDLISCLNIFNSVSCSFSEKIFDKSSLSVFNLFRIPTKGRFASILNSTGVLIVKSKYSRIKIITTVNTKLTIPAKIINKSFFDASGFSAGGRNFVLALRASF